LQLWLNGITHVIPHNSLYLKNISKNILSFSSCILTSLFCFSQTLNSTAAAFIENKGQIVNQSGEANSDVLFILNGKNYNIQLRKTGYSYEIFSAENLPKEITASKQFQKPAELLNVKLKTSRVDFDFYGMNSNLQIIKEKPSADFFNYYLNGKQITYVHSYEKITYKNVYKNIDVEFILNQGEEVPFKYNVLLHPGARLDDLKILVAGADKITIAQDGPISYSTQLGDIKEIIPISYYSDSPDENIKVDFSIQNNFISFKAQYDNKKTFVIDPSTNRIWGTYYGDAGTDYCNAISSDASNNVYITGYTLNSTNIATNGTYQSTIGGSFDAYLVKFNSSGVRQWGTYFGGSSVEAAYGIFITSSGYIYVTGDTFSTSNVASGGAHQTTYGGGIDDAFLAKFDVNGQRKWSTYYGGLQHDIASSVTVDSNEDVIICGHTESLNNIATVTSYQNSWSNLFDVFVVKFDSAGVRQWGTYYGDNSMEEAFAVDCDASDNIYVTGFTSSTSNIATTLSYQTSFGGGAQDAYIAKFNAAGNNLLWATYYGGTGNDQGASIKIDNAGNIFVAGNTTSPNAIASLNSYQQILGSADDAFLVEFNSAGARQWGTYFGGNDVDYIAELQFDANGNLLFSGSTQSTNQIATTGAYQFIQSSPGNYDAFFAKFKTNGTMMLATYYGGTSSDNGRGITIDNNNHIYIAGDTYSNDSMSTVGAHSLTNMGGGDAFLAKFCVAPEPYITSGDTTICTGDTITLATQTTFSSYSWSNSTTASTIVLTDTNSIVYYFTVTVTDGFGCSGTSDTVTIVFDICNSVSEINSQNISVYPVPANDFIQIDLGNYTDADFTIEIYSSNGDLVITSTAKTVDIKKLSPGIYILKVRANGTTAESKLIKQ